MIPSIGFFSGRVRVEEKLLLAAYAQRGVEVQRFIHGMLG